MGSTAAQGWFLFVFLLGFTLAPAGLVALGWPATLAGVALLVIALGGFRSIKEPSGNLPTRRERVPASLGARAAEGV